MRGLVSPLHVASAVVLSLFTEGALAHSQLAVVRPFGAVDADLLPASFDTWNELSPCSVDAKHESPVAVLFLVYSQTYKASSKAQQAFDDVAAEFEQNNGWDNCFADIIAIGAGIDADLDLYEPSQQNENQMWVNGPNRVFESVIRNIQSGKWGTYESLYLMEMDSVPVKPYWLDALLSEVEQNRPFAILGSKYVGDKWDAFYDELPSSLVNHINGNALYNITHPLLNDIVSQLEAEATTPYNSVAYDYRISQISEDRANQDAIKETKAISNYASTNILPKHIGEEAIVHGATVYRPWDSEEEITLVVSDWNDEQSAYLLSHLDDGEHPFSSVVLVLPTDTQAPNLHGQSPSVPVTIYNRRHSEPDYMDVCSAPVTTKWFMLTNSYHRLKTNVSLMMTSEGKPVIPFAPATEEYCYKFPSCTESMAHARSIHPAQDTFVQNNDMIYSTDERNDMCTSLLMESYGMDGRQRAESLDIAAVMPSATAYIAHLASKGLANKLYLFSDRTVYGSRDAFAQVFPYPIPDNEHPDTSHGSRLLLEASASNSTGCQMLSTNETCLESALSCIWREATSSCRSDSSTATTGRQDIFSVTTRNAGKGNQRRIAKSSESKKIALPPFLEHNLAGVSDRLGLTDTPIFWHVPKAGGTTMKNFLFCLGLVLANDIGVRFGHDQDKELRLVYEPQSGYPVVNVDATTPDGLKRAKDLGFAESGLANIVLTPYVHETASIFTPNHRGRMFTLIRHPVDRATSMFYYLQDATWESTYSPETKNWTIQQYCDSSYPDRDWMVRMLVSNFNTDLRQKDLDFAKLILREKFVVGLMTKMEESVDRFQRYFGLDDASGKKEECAQTMLGPGKGSNRHQHSKVEPDSDEWKALEKLNYWDIQLYDYAVALFEEQTSLMDDIVDSSPASLVLQKDRLKDISQSASGTDIADVQAQLLEKAQDTNKKYREELKELRSMLRQAQTEADRVADLEAQLKRAQSLLSDVEVRSVANVQSTTESARFKVSAKSAREHQPPLHSSRPESPSVLSFGTSVTWGAALENRSDAYPHLLSHEVRNRAIRAAGANYPSLCTQTMAGDDEGKDGEVTSYNVITLEFSRRAAEDDGHALRVLVERLRARYPDALMVFIQDWHPILINADDKFFDARKWNSQKGGGHPLHSDEFESAFLAAQDKGVSWIWSPVIAKSAQIIDEVSKSVGGYVVALPRPDKPQDFLQYRDWFASDWIHLSKKGHATIASQVQQLIDKVGIVSSPRVGTWGSSGDYCLSWFESGVCPLNITNGNVMMETIKPGKHALSFLGGEASIIVRNPFPEPMQLHLTYMATSPAPSLYPKAKISVIPNPGWKGQPIQPPTFIDPTWTDHVEAHVSMSSWVGVVHPGDNAVHIHPLEKRELPFRLVATSINNIFNQTSARSWT